MINFYKHSFKNIAYSIYIYTNFFSKNKCGGDKTEIESACSLRSVPLCKYVLKQRIQMVNYQIWSPALTFQKIFCIIPFTKSSLKIIKNAFHFILKALFVLKILKFLSSFYGHVEKTAPLEMICLISKFMTSQPG